MYTTNGYAKKAIDQGCSTIGNIGFTALSVGVVGYASSVRTQPLGTLLVAIEITTVGYARPVSLLVYITVGYTSSEIDLAYTTVGYASSETDLGYAAVG